MDLKEVKIWNIKYNLLTAKEISDIVNSWLDGGRKGIHLTGVDACVMVQAQENDLLRKAILESDIVNIDSYLPAKKLAKLGYDVKERVTTPDVMEGFFKIKGFPIRGKRRNGQTHEGYIERGVSKDENRRL